jgi:hypothetical protein
MAGASYRGAHGGFTLQEDLVRALSKFGEVCYASIQAPDDVSESSLSWALVTFKLVGPAAAAAARGELELKVGDGPLSMVGEQLDASALAVLRLPIEKLVTRIQSASMHEEQQLRDAFKHFSRTQKILLTIRSKRQPIPTRIHPARI